MGSSCQYLVSHAFSDVDIYENLKQTSLSQMASEIWLFLFSIYSSFYYRGRSRFATCFKRKKIISLETLLIERFALNFHKCPHLVKALTPSFKFLSKYLLAFYAFTLLHPEFEDQVYEITLYSSKIDANKLNQWKCLIILKNLV